MISTEKGDSIRITRNYLDSLLVEGRIVGAVHPSSKIHLFGRSFDTPIMTGALSHLKNGMAGYAQGAKQAGAICSIGMGSVEDLEHVLTVNRDVIKVIKPYADEQEILSRIQAAERLGALGVGMDVEHSINQNDDADSEVDGYAMKLPTLEELSRYVASTGLPFFIKGALSVQDAIRCKEIGCAGVILSHHNGLMRWAVPPVMLLPDIRKAVGEDFLLIADGGIQDGYDAFKALALGADLVCVGRPLMGPYSKEGSEGLADFINKMTGELKVMMARTGACDLTQIAPEVIHPVNWNF
ncbi:MAG: alpha-hydroxy-acid oxidizing protein [Blautia sp.]|nr:alpha-hydroxy-acid oxidizing protein [Blautia sp.]